MLPSDRFFEHTPLSNYYKTETTTKDSHWTRGYLLPPAERPDARIGTALNAGAELRGVDPEMEIPRTQRERPVLLAS